MISLPTPQGLYVAPVNDDLYWDSEVEQYVLQRPLRYPGALAVRPEWCREAMRDEFRAHFEQDPKSRVRACRTIGYSPSAGRVLVVIAYRDLDGDLHLINAWPANGSDLAKYEED